MMNSERKSQREVFIKKLKPLDFLLASCDSVTTSNYDDSIIIQGQGPLAGQITSNMKKFFGKEIRVVKVSNTYYEYLGTSVDNNIYLWREEWFENDFVDKELFEI